MTRPGAMMAASTRFSVRVVGKGGHAAIPHEAVDPVVAAAQVWGVARVGARLRANGASRRGRLCHGFEGK